MTGLAGPGGPRAAQFEDGLRLLAAALALKGDARSAPAAISAGCGAIQCFLKILEVAGAQHVPDPEGNVARLREQCGALLTLRQEPADALLHTLEAARLARDEAARLMVLLGSEQGR
jgi:hypothetical protein